ncbi:hypothetical protein [Selenomonas bovis]|uniref:hypothetical protein n=1 Tax=Selenomonas bovis TaxID=416586 RepID=UPI00037596BA|nr:hypothetical protein [Selenomonas bovis]
MMKNHNETKKRKSGYNPAREHHAGDDCLTYTYARWNEETHSYDTIVLTAGQDGVTEDIILLLDQMDHDSDLIDRYEEELRDPGFEKRRKAYESDPEDGDEGDPWNQIEAPHADLTEDAERREKPNAEKIRRVVEEDFTPEQQDLFFSHYGECKQLEQIRQEEAVRTGKPVTPQAMNNRKNKMIRKVAKKAFGVEPVKRRKTDKKD